MDDKKFDALSTRAEALGITTDSTIAVGSIYEFCVPHLAQAQVEQYLDLIKEYSKETFPFSEEVKPLVKGLSTFCESEIVRCYSNASYSTSYYRLYRHGVKMYKVAKEQRSAILFLRERTKVLERQLADLPEMLRLGRQQRRAIAGQHRFYGPDECGSSGSEAANEDVEDERNDRVPPLEEIPDERSFSEVYATCRRSLTPSAPSI